MSELLVSVNLSRDQIAAYYRGELRAVVARASNGQTVQFPASVLHKFITLDGVHGKFRLRFDERHKFVGIEPLAPA
ncbi:MAG TPA: DUF2835 family protein [Opitutus sp.]|nr:DUF2835 family protein [Opitutus sp.]